MDQEANSQTRKVLQYPETGGDGGGCVDKRRRKWREEEEDECLRNKMAKIAKHRENKE